MFAHTRSPILSLFSSSGSHPLQLFSTHTDPSLPADSLIHLLNDLTSLPAPLTPGQLTQLPVISSRTPDDPQNASSSTTQQEGVSNEHPISQEGVSADGGGTSAPEYDAEDPASTHALNSASATDSSVCDPVRRERDQIGRSLSQTILHIQSPSLRTTFLRCPPVGSTTSQASLEDTANSELKTRRSLAHPAERSHPAQSPSYTRLSNPELATHGDLGVRHHWLHFQVRNLAKPWSFEFGLKDVAGHEGLVRCSTFQRKPILKIKGRRLPLLHLPFAFPDLSSRSLTAWCTFAIHLPPLLGGFASTDLLDDRLGSDPNDPHLDDEDEEEMRAQVPAHGYSHLTYVKVYANCRLKRIWFTESGPTQKLPWEFALYGPTSAAI